MKTMKAADSEFFKGLILGIVLTLVLAVGYCAATPGGTAEEAPAAKLTAFLLEQSRGQRREIAALKDTLASVGAAIDLLETETEPIVDKVRVQHALFAIDTTIPSPAIQAGKYWQLAPSMDSVKMGSVQRVGVDAMPWPVPQFFTHAYTSAIAAIDSLVKVDGLHRQRWEWANRLYIKMDDQHNTDSTAIFSLTSERDWWKRQVRPRCSMKCGIAIGVVGVVGTALAAKKVLDLGERRQTP